MLAFFFIIVFAQKTGAGLFLHNLFHVSKVSTAQDATGKSNEISFACTCLDDLQLPYEEPEIVTLAAIAPVYSETYGALTPEVCFCPTVYAVLRGPPALIS